MDEEKIFGPLTFRQFLYTSGCLGVIYLAYNYLELKLSIPITILAIVFLISAFISHPAVIIDENYIKLKRSNCDNLEEFQRWLRKKIAVIQSQISQREESGMVPDPELSTKLKMFETAMQNIK